MTKLAKEASQTAGTASRLTAHPVTSSLGGKNNPHASGGTRPVLRTRGLVFSTPPSAHSLVAQLEFSPTQPSFTPKGLPGR